MTFYITEALLDGLNLQPGSQIGIFDIDPGTGAQICVGAASVTQIISPSTYLEMIASMNDGSVPGQSNGFTPGNPFIFKFICQSGVLIEQVNYSFPYPGYNQVFASLGSAIVNLSGTSPVSNQQFINLNQGWTWISSFILPFNTEIQSLVAQVSELIVIKDLNSFYQPGNPNSSLLNWNTASGYFIKTTGASQLVVEGSLPANKTINLASGLNLIPVLSDQPVNIYTLFSGQLGKVEIIKEAIGLSIFWPAYNISTLQQLIPGKAYLVEMNQSATITF